MLEVARGIVGESCVDKFENYLALGPCGDVEQYVHYLNISGVEAKVRFREALKSMVKRLESNGCTDVVIAAHLTYLAGYSVTPNPIVPEVLRIAEDVRVIHVADDWYDIIIKVARSALERGGECERLELGYTIDPETVVNWRGADFSLASLSEEIGASKWYLIAAKHPLSVFQRLLEEALGVKSYLKAYISHPIRSVRRLYAEIKCLTASLKGCKTLDSISFTQFPLVTMIEGFKSYVKELLEERHNGVVLFEPTAIDELLLDAHCGGDGRCTIKKLLLEPRRESRWPYPQDTMAEYTYGGSDVKSTLKSALTALRGEKLDDYIEGLSRVGEATRMLSGAERALEYAFSRIKEALEEQVEARDYKYVEQSDILVAASPALLYCGDDGEVKLSLLPSRGVSDEVKRATALSKPIYFYVLPVSIDSLTYSLLKYAGLSLREEGSVKRLLVKAFEAKGRVKACNRAPQPSEIVPSLSRLGLGVFSEIPSSARVIVMPPISEEGVLRDSEEILRFYRESRPLAVSPRSYARA